jgi:hypothetical protein
MSNLHEEIAAVQNRLEGIDRTIDALENERPRLRKRLAELSEALTRTKLPCWDCSHPQARDARHFLTANQGSTGQMTPSGLPLNCCRVVVAQSRSPVCV